MAIKLESQVRGIECGALMEIVSPTDTPAIGLKVEEARSLVGDEWKVDPSKAKQVCTFHGEDGPVELMGVVPEDQAIEIAGAYKVVVAVEITTTALPTFQAGRKSRTLLALSVRRVVEVWASAKKCTWKAADVPLAAPAGKTFDPSTGRIAA